MPDVDNNASPQSADQSRAADQTAAAVSNPLDHDGDGKSGGSLPAAERLPDELVKEASDAGVMVDHRWSADTLRAKIDEAKAANAEIFGDAFADAAKAKAAVAEDAAKSATNKAVELDMPATAAERDIWRRLDALGHPMIYRAAEGRQQQLSDTEYHAAFITCVHDDRTVNLRVHLDMRGSFDVERVTMFIGPLHKLPRGMCYQK